MRFLPLLCLLATPLLPRGACAQTATPRLQDAIVVAKGSTISISRLPISTPAGTIYRDVTIELRVDAGGNVSLATDSAGRAVAAGMPAAPARIALRSVPSGSTPAAAAPDAIALPQRPSPPIVMQRFVTGTYAGKDGSLVVLQDRGVDLIHHVPAWTITSADSGGYVGLLTFYSGPPFMNPRANRLKRAGITSSEYAYGTSDSGDSPRFGSGALIGVAQDGKVLRVVSFHSGCCSDHADPTGELDYTRVGG